jgi:hypothetical protein
MTPRGRLLQIHATGSHSSHHLTPFRLFVCSLGLVNLAI